MRAWADVQLALLLAVLVTSWAPLPWTVPVWYQCTVMVAAVAGELARKTARALVLRREERRRPSRGGGTA